MSASAGASNNPSVIARQSTTSTPQSATNSQSSSPSPSDASTPTSTPISAFGPQSRPTNQPSGIDSDQSNQFSPSLIAVIVVIPVGFTALMLLYWRRRIWKRFRHHEFADSQSGSRSVTMTLPPGGTGADAPEGQRRADRMRRTRFGGRARRPSRSDSVRTVPEYSADPQATEMTLAQTQRTSESQPSFLMRLMGQHATQRTSTDAVVSTAAVSVPTLLPTSVEDEEPPPGYECQAGSSTQAGSESVHPHPSSSSSTVPLQTTPPQSHTIELHLNRTYTSTSSIGSTTSTQFPKPPAQAFRALFHSRINSLTTSYQTLPPPPSPEMYRLPSSGATPDQIRFLESPANLTRLGVNRSSTVIDRPSSFVLVPSTPAPTLVPLSPLPSGLVPASPLPLLPPSLSSSPPSLPPLSLSPISPPPSSPPSLPLLSLSPVYPPPSSPPSSPPPSFPDTILANPTVLVTPSAGSHYS